MSEQPKQRRKRSFPVKPEVLPLLEKTMRERGFVYTTQEQMYVELAEKSNLSTDTIKNFFNPQFKRPPSKNTIQSIATTLGWMPEDLVEEWTATTKTKQTSKNNSEVTIDISIFQKMLDKQINNLTFNNSFLTEKLIKTADVYVPLGLIERKEKSRRREVTPENGSELYRANQYEISREFENDQFLTEVLLEGNSSKSQGRRIAIIGEPGSGKSTRLQQIAMWLIEQSLENHVIWISLADLRGRSLEDYLLQEWLKNALSKLESSKKDQEELVKIFNQDNVWLLLDGIDEMGLSENPLAWVNRQLCGWIDKAKIIVTSRINVWDGNRQALNQFDVYRNLDFSNDQRDQFISNFLDNKELSEGLINELNKQGKERIRDLVRNPLRLTLICRSWQKRQGSLPNTKAGLYQECVEAYYDWKEEPKPTKAQRKELHKALGELAKQALSRDDFRFRLTESQISEVLGESDQGLFKLAFDLGWLNEIGRAEEHYERIFAFFHPSFQEYFAALTIDKFEFLLNHIPDDPQKGIYKIFESKWLEVALLWIGRPDIENNQKDKLINQLFPFYYFPESANIYFIKASIIAIQLISEFEEAKNAKEIIDFAIINAFGVWDDETQIITHFQFEKDFRTAISSNNHFYLLEKLNQILTLVKSKNINFNLDSISIDIAEFLIEKEKDNFLATEIVEDFQSFLNGTNYTDNEYYKKFSFYDSQGFINEIKNIYGENYNSKEFWERYEQGEYKKNELSAMQKLRNIKLYSENKENIDFTKESNFQKSTKDVRIITEKQLTEKLIQNPYCLFDLELNVISNFLEFALCGRYPFLLEIIKKHVRDVESHHEYEDYIFKLFSHCLDEIFRFIWVGVDTFNDLPPELCLIKKKVEYDFFCYQHPETELLMEEYLNGLQKEKIKDIYKDLPSNLCEIALQASEVHLFSILIEFVIYLENECDLFSPALMDQIFLKVFEFDGLVTCISPDISKYFSSKLNYQEFHHRWFNHRFSNELSDRRHLNQQVSNQPFFLSVKTENLNLITDEVKLLKRFKKRLISSIPAEIKSSIQAPINHQSQASDMSADDLINQIEDIVLAIITELKVENFNLFLDNKNPSQLLLNLREQFSDIVQIEWNR